MSNQKKKSINYSIELLRIFLCFEVVLCHFGGGDKNIFFYSLRTCAAPLFILISFSLTDYYRIVNDKHQFSSRLKRLIIPNIIWTVVYFIVLNLISTYTHESYSIMDFFSMT